MNFELADATIPVSDDGKQLFIICQQQRNCLSNDNLNRIILSDPEQLMQHLRSCSSIERPIINLLYDEKYIRPVESLTKDQLVPHYGGGEHQKCSYAQTQKCSSAQTWTSNGLLTVKHQY